MMISADPKDMFGALKHFCLEDLWLAHSFLEGFLVASDEGLRCLMYFFGGDSTFGCGVWSMMKCRKSPQGICSVTILFWEVPGG